MDGLEENSRLESQKSDMNLITLERNSFNFLEYVADTIVWPFWLTHPDRYAKMQMQTLPDPTEGLSFDTIVPKQTSTRHVASAAFYHCLGEWVFVNDHMENPQRFRQFSQPRILFI